jgi:hypothetical protein
MLFGAPAPGEAGTIHGERCPECIGTFERHRSEMPGFLYSGKCNSLHHNTKQ